MGQALHTVAGKTPTAANRLSLDYEREAERLGPPPVPIIDAHAHINGGRAAVLYRRAAELYGVDRVFSQTQLSQAGEVRDALGGRVHFVATPEYMEKDKAHAFGDGFLANLSIWRREHGARMVKLWCAPRFVDIATENGLRLDDFWPIDAPRRVEIALEAKRLGMALMVHVGDPDTWFATKYADPTRYGTKADQHAALDRLLEKVDMPCLAAHMAGWPEDLGMLTTFLDRHHKVVLDTSATKWMVRELSMHPRSELLEFLQRFEGRICFGSDIVTMDEHLGAADGDLNRFGATLAANEAEAFDLYASRYWALRTMFETEYTGESPIADPDLVMTKPERYDAMSAPALRGFALPDDVLRVLYRGAAEATLMRWYTDGPYGAEHEADATAG